MSVLSTQLCIFGKGLGAWLTALQARRVGMSVCVVQTGAVEEPPLAELAVMGGPSVSFAQHSLKLWRSLSTPTAPFTQTRVFTDLATSPELMVKLKEEAMLDALSGENVAFTEQTPSGIAPALCFGARVVPEGTVLAPHAAVLAQQEAEKAGVRIFTAGVAGVVLQPLTVTLANGTVIAPEHLLLASGAQANHWLPQWGLKLPLRPTRMHVMRTSATPEARAAWPAPDGIWLHRLPYGHLFVQVEGVSITATYDGVADPSQATHSHTIHMPTLAALAAHLRQLMPGLASAWGNALHTAVHTGWVTPDYLPAMGNWQGLPQVHVAVGWAGRGALYAPAAAQLVVQQVAGAAAAHHHNPLAPNRFVSGHWQAVRAPASLAEPSATGGGIIPTRGPVYAEHVRFTPGHEVHTAATIHEVGKTVQNLSATSEIRETGKTVQHLNEHAEIHEIGKTVQNLNATAEIRETGKTVQRLNEHAEIHEIGKTVQNLNAGAEIRDVGKTIQNLNAGAEIRDVGKTVQNLNAGAEIRDVGKTVQNLNATAEIRDVGKTVQHLNENAEIHETGKTVHNPNAGAEIHETGKTVQHLNAHAEIHETGKTVHNPNAHAEIHEVGKTVNSGAPKDIHMVGKTAEASHNTTIHMVEKRVETSRAGPVMQERSKKPRIQMAGVNKGPIK